MQKAGAAAASASDRVAVGFHVPDIQPGTHPLRLMAVNPVRFPATGSMSSRV